MESLECQKSIMLSLLSFWFTSFFCTEQQQQKRRMRIKFHAKHPLIKYHSMINDDTYFSGYVSACLKDDMDSKRSYVLGKKVSLALSFTLTLKNSNNSNIYRWFLMRFFFASLLAYCSYIHNMNLIWKSMAWHKKVLGCICNTIEEREEKLKIIVAVIFLSITLSFVTF